MNIVDIVSHPAFIWSMIGIFVILPFAWFFVKIVTSLFVFRNTLTRRSKKKWARRVPKKIHTDSQKMYAAGIAWSQENAEHKKDVHIEHDGLNLYGEYFDFGYDRCVMILSGRTESSTYCYYFAAPYAKNGFNVLVIDHRAHGLSDGNINTVGFEESGDNVEWLKLLQNEFGIKSVIIHGICIGSAGGLYTILRENCPDIVDGIVAEGMYANFFESLKNHVIQYRLSTFFVLDMVNVWMNKFTGHSLKVGPLDVIDQLDKPFLMLHGKEDKYSLAELAVQIHEKAGSKLKRLVWFEKGRHSFLRITDTEKYDSSIEQFIADVYAEKEAASEITKAIAD